MAKFIPRTITSEMAAQGYNNEGCGKLIGYIAEADQHEETCRYRITTSGNRDKPNRESCTCRIGLWQQKTNAKTDVDNAPKTAKRNKKIKPAKAKSKAKKPKRAR